MKHDLASEKLLELAYGELSAREARDVAAHAEGCERCREELARIRETRSLMAQLPMEPPPEGGLGIVMAAAREAASARGRRGTGLLPPWLWAGSLGAVAAVVVAVVSWQLTRTAPSDGLRARDGDLLGAPSPAVVAVAPPAAAPEPPSPAEPPVEQPKAVASKAEEPKAKLAERDAMKKGAVAVAKRDEGARTGLGVLGAGAGADRRGSGAGAVGSIRLAEPEASAREESAGRAAGRGGGLALQAAPPPPPAPRAAARPETAAPAPAPAAPPANVWAPPESAAAPAARAPSGAAEEREQLADSYGAAPAAKAARRAEAAKASAEREDEEKARRLSQPRSSERKAAATATAAPRPPRPAGSVEVRTFGDCPGERRRTVERASDGTVLRYVREGDQRTIEHRYAPDGRLVTATAMERGVRRELPLDTPGLALRASDAGIDAPPRCQVP